MKTVGSCRTFLLVTLLASTGVGVSHAQFGGLLNSAKEKAANKAQQKMDQPSNADAPPQNPDGQTPAAQNPQDATQQQAGSHPMLHINHGFDFVPGPVVLFQDNFASTTIGAMPPVWKTNGAAQVVTLQDFPGKWLQVGPSATLKLTKPVDFPSHFTVEFDVIAVAENIEDMNDFLFGFAGDNSVRSYITDAYNENALNGIDLQYMNGTRGDITAASSVTRYHNDTVSDLTVYANRVMHVSIAVDGDMMQVYLDKNKIVGAKLFDHNPNKYFYLSTSSEYKHDAQMLFGNFRIGGFK